MSVSFTIPQGLVPIGALKPAADAAGRSGRWISLKNAEKAWVVIYVDQGNAATIQLDLDQATAVAGTGAKQISGNVQIFTDLDVATNGGTYTRQSDAKTYTTDAALKEKVVVLQIDPAQVFDTGNNFDCIRVKTGASNAANITSAVYYVVPKYAAAAINYGTD